MTSSPQRLSKQIVDRSKRMDDSSGGTTKNYPAAKSRNSVSSPTTLASTTLICNTDAAWRSDTKSAGLRWLFTDQNLTEIRRGSQFQDHVSSTLLAEGLTIRAALLHAVSSEYTKIWLRSDSQMLVKAINLKHRPSELYGTLTAIASISASHLLHISYVSKLQNGHADLIAKACFNELNGV
ncbi:hypothetical protein DY000_02050932 [Brassica cretica]|uniref:RNase H type-1 domain-containing protein n=1 Tax=Brassica cretica TaxID=69181 RepID=A0ABQ7F721_BRACR|nr:hypothetical protein DY000_02050932 [Brassica cretica]